MSYIFWFIIILAPLHIEMHTSHENTQINKHIVKTRLNSITLP